jgi:hypothetical protein
MQRIHTAVYAVIAIASLAFATMQPEHADDLEHSMVSLSASSFTGAAPQRTGAGAGPQQPFGH